MKKTMFITSVIMVVVMAIALTTSSLAWFTAAGQNEVTTTALTINAQANASTGIQIGRSASGAWFNTINLADAYTGEDSATTTDDIVGGMMPLMPLADDGTPTIALTQTALANASFVGNKIGTNGQFAYQADGSTSITPYTTGYYVDDSIFVTNMASGSSAKAVYIVPTVTFKTSAGAAYSASTRDPDLFVAILADTDDTDASLTWEVVNVFHSNTNDATGKIDVARTTEAFASGQTVASAYTSTIDIADLRAVTADVVATGAKAGGTSTALAAITNDNAYGVAKNFKVVAWYAGDTLDNNNSASFGLQVIITFHAYDAV